MKNEKYIDFILKFIKKYCLLISGLIVLFLSDIVWRKPIYDLLRKFTGNYDMSIICAAQIAVVGVTLTIVSFTSSHNNLSYYDIPAKDILNIRKKGFSLSKMIVGELILSTLTIIFFYTKCYLCLSWCFISTCYMCLEYGVSYIPLIIKDEEALINLLKKSKENIGKVKINPTYFELINRYILQEGLDKVFMEIKDDENNVKLINDLLNINLNYLKTLSYYTDISEEKLKVNKIVSQEMSLIKTFSALSEENSEILKEDIDEKFIGIYIAQVLSEIKKRDNQIDIKTKEEMYKLISAFFNNLIYGKNDKGKKIIYFSYEHLLESTISSCDFWFVKMFKRKCSYNFFWEINNSYMTRNLFAKTCLALYAMYYYEDVEQYVKEEIEEIMYKDEKISENEIIPSMNAIFNKFLETFDLPLDIFINDYEGFKWEKYIINNVHNCVITPYFIFEWWFSCFFSSYKVFEEFSIEKFKNINENDVGSLVEYLKSSFYNEKFILKNQKNFQRFYKIDNMYIDESVQQQLNKFVEDTTVLKKINDAANVCIDENLPLLEESLKCIFTNIFEKYRYSNGNLKEAEIIGINTVLELYDLEVSKEIYSKMIIDGFSNKIKQDIKGKLKDRILSFSKESREDTKNIILALEPQICTIRCLKILDENDENKFQDLDKNIDLVNDIILPNYFYGKHDAVDFKYEMIDFELKMLNEDLIEKMLMEYIRNDGTYFYEGAQYSKDVLKSILMKKYFCIRIFIKYTVDVCEDKAVIVDPYGRLEKQIQR